MLSHPARRETGELPVQAAMKYDTVAHQVAINLDAALVTSSHTGKSPRRRPVVRQLIGEWTRFAGRGLWSQPGFRAILAGTTDEQMHARQGSLVAPPHAGFIG
jgi:hypothetical protein